MPILRWVAEQHPSDLRPDDPFAGSDVVVQRPLGRLPGLLPPGFRGPA